MAADLVTLRGYAVGVPPLSYQWLKDGVPVCETDDGSYSFLATPRNAGNYQLVVRNRYGRATSDVSVVRISPFSPGHKPTRVISNPYLM